jgi:MFS family permease
MSAEAATTARVSPLRVAVASFIGTTVEFYDFLIYGTAAALVFPKLFFPNASHGLRRAVVVRHVRGGILRPPPRRHRVRPFRRPTRTQAHAGVFACRHGCFDVLIGLLPTYAQIGVAAPILLTLLRLAQGFAVGGEWGGATLMAVEHAAPERKGFYGAFPQMGAPAGTATATLAFFLVSQLPDDQFLSWGWRIPFLFSAVLIVIGLVIRLTLSESPDFAKLSATAGVVRMPIADAFRKHWRQILLVAGSYLSQGVFAYICVAYLVAYGTSVAKIDRTWALFGVFVAAVVAVVMYPLFGSLSDRVGRKALFLIGVVLMAVTIGPVFALINTGKPVLFLVALVLVFGLAMAHPRPVSPVRCFPWCSMPTCATAASRSDTPSLKWSARRSPPRSPQRYTARPRRAIRSWPI